MCMYCFDQKFKIYFKRQQPKPSFLAVQTAGQSPALSLGSLCYIRALFGSSGTRGPVPCSFSPHRGPEVGAEKAISLDSGLWRRPTFLFVNSKIKDPGGDTWLAAALADLSAASWVVWVSADHPTTEIPSSRVRRSRHRMQLADLFLLGLVTKHPRRGTDVTFIWGGGAASQRHLLKLRKGSHCICWETKWDFRLGHQIRARRPQLH